MTISEAIKFVKKYKLSNKARDDLIRSAVREEKPKTANNDRLKEILEKKDAGSDSYSPIDAALLRIKSGYYNTGNRTGLRPR